MLGNEAQASSKVEALRCTSWSAGANNGPWIDVSGYEGDIMVVYNVGAVTGSATLKLQDADDTSGTNSADVTGATTAALSSAGSTGAIIVNASAVRKGLRLVNTVATGPALVGAVLVSRPKNF